MSILIDLLIILSIAVFTFLGYKKGLIKVAFGLLSFVVALVLALILYKPVSNVIINNTEIDEKISTSISGALQKKYNIDPNAKNVQLQLDTESMKNLPEAITSYVSEYTSDAISSTAGQLVENLADKITILIINLGVLTILNVVIRLLLLLAKALADVIAELPIIKQCDKFGGTVYGLLKGIISVYLVFAIILMFSPVLNIEQFTQSINDSYIGYFIYNNNILLNILL